MSEPDIRELIFDWNWSSEAEERNLIPVEFDDETLRDGLQSPSVIDPSIEQKKRILHLMNDLGIHTADIGLPGAGPRARGDVEALAGEIVRSGMNIAANCAARTVLADVEPVVEISHKVGIPIECCTFIGSSPIRQFAEEWSVERMLKHTVEAVSFAVKEGLPVMFVTEDTVRAHPDTLSQLFDAAIDAGASRLCLCDTCGHATPEGVRSLVSWTKEFVGIKGADVKIDWHGHRDRGLSIPNALAAIEAGADRIHGTALGIGERVGNVPMDTLLVNLKLMGLIDNDLTKLPEYVRTVSEATGVPINVNYPVLGRDAFRTGTGVHAAAIIKAKKKGDDWLADRVYSGVPAGMVGRHQKIDIGPMSGKSNVIYWLETEGIKPDGNLVNEIMELAKKSDRILTRQEIMGVIDSYNE